MFKKYIILLLVLVFSFFNIAKSEVSEHIKIQAQSSQTTVKKGDSFFVKVTIQLDDYWYNYGFVSLLNDEGIGPAASELSVKPADSFEQIKNIYVDKPEFKFDEGFEMTIDIYKKAEFLIPLIAKKDIDFSNDNISVVFYTQLCDTVRCLPSTEYITKITSSELTISDLDLSKKIKLSITYDENSYPFATYPEDFKRDELSKDSPSHSEDSHKEDKIQKTEYNEMVDQKKSEGFLSFLWFSMLMGAIALLTPCVFPMIPITVSFFTKRTEKVKGRGLRDSFIYSLGIISTFTAIGILVAAIAGPTGISKLATNGWVNLAIAAVFIIFALNLFGAFEIQLPTSLMNKLNTKSQGDGIASVLVMGLVFSLTSFTCTVPFVGSTLISVSTGEWFYPILGMLGFSTVFALPFFLLALFPSYMTKLPKAGGWMNNIKVVMGFIEIAAAIKFLSNADLYWAMELITRDLFISIWIACIVLIVLYILGLFKLPHDSPIHGVSATRIIFAIIFSSLSIWFATGLLDKPLGELDAFMPPKEYGTIQELHSSSMINDGSENSELTHWHTDYKLALEIARKLNKPLFVDFTGWQCTNCRWMEKNMFTRSTVNDLINQMVKVKLYTDSRKESEIANRQMQQDRYGAIDLPLYVILDNSEKVIATKAFTRDEEEFITFLKKGLNSK